MATTIHEHFERSVAPDGPNATLVTTFLATTLAEDDILKVRRIPRRVKIVDAWIRTSDIDTHATPTSALTLRVNNGTTQKVVIHEADVGQAGGIARPSKVPATEPGLGWTAPDSTYWLELVSATGPATAAEGTIEIGVTLSGHTDPGDITE